MIIEQDKMMNVNDDTSTCIPNLGDKNTYSSILEDSNTWIPKLEDVYLHLVSAFLQFLNREKEKNKENLEFISKVNAAISNLSAAFHLADSRSNQLQVQDNIEHIFFMAVRYDLLKAHIEEIAKNNKQCFSNTSGKAASMVLAAIENGSEKEVNNEKSGSIDETINHKTTTELQNNVRYTKDDKSENNKNHKKGEYVENDTQHELNSTDKDSENHKDPDERIQVFFHCDLCKKTFQEEKELKKHKEDWRGSSWSCARYRFPENKYCRDCKGFYLARDTLEHEKGCTGSKINTSEERVITLSQSNVLTTHKRANPDDEKELQNVDADLINHRSKIRKKTNVEENIITELKEEHNDSVIDIKEETMEEEGIGDPLSTVDPCLPGRPVQEELHYDDMKTQVDENNQPYSEITNEVTKGLKRVLHDNAEILAKVENTESSINTLRLQIEQILQYSIASHGKLDFLARVVPAVMDQAGSKNWSSVEEVENNLKNDHNGKFSSHLKQIFTNIATNKNTIQEITKVEMYILLDFLFDTPEEASAYTGSRESRVANKKVFKIACKNVYKLVKDICTQQSSYNPICFEKDLIKYFHAAPGKTEEGKIKQKEKKSTKKKANPVETRKENNTRALKNSTINSTLFNTDIGEAPKPASTPAFTPIPGH